MYQVAENRHYTTWPADQMQTDENPPSRKLVEVSKCEQHRGENVCEHSGVLIRNFSKALKLQIFSAGGHLDRETVNAPLQLEVWRRATVANNSRAGCPESPGSNSCRACAVSHFGLWLPMVFWFRRPFTESPVIITIKWFAIILP